jgi:hypothetical protein
MVTALEFVMRQKETESVLFKVRGGGGCANNSFGKGFGKSFLAKKGLAKVLGTLACACFVCTPQRLFYSTTTLPRGGSRVEEGSKRAPLPPARNSTTRV